MQPTASTRPSGKRSSRTVLYRKPVRSGPASARRRRGRTASPAGWR
jgi:hypothetical protein